MTQQNNEKKFVLPGELNPSKRVTATAHPVQGLTCFHEYQERVLKTLSIDMLYTTIDALQTQTILALSTTKTDVIFSENAPPEKVRKRVEDYVREYFDGNFYLNTRNNFQPDVGLASSASGYSCIAGGLARLLGITEDLSEISKMARRGSFSASASVTGGISIVKNREHRQETYGERVFSPAQLEDLTLVIALASYNKDSFDFYREAEGSPVLETARKQAKTTANEMIRAFEGRDIDKLASLVENHNILSYTVLHTGAYYEMIWNPETITMIRGVRDLRKAGYPIFFSMNTGPNVFCYCFSDEARNAIKEYCQNNLINTIVTRVGGSVEWINPN